MSIASEITKLNTNLTASYTACNSKGATMPTDQNFDNLATCISSIQTGSGGGGILEQLMADIVAGNNPVDITALQTAETQINAFLSI